MKILVIFLGLIIFVSATIWVGKNYLLKPVPDSIVSAVTDPSLLPSPDTNNSSASSSLTVSANLWKEYKNTDYNFVLIIPAHGMVTADQSTKIGDCGASVQKDSNPSPYEAEYTIDNLIQISVENYPGSIEDYLADNGADGKYNLVALSKANADEAFELKGLTEAGKTWANGYYEGIPFGLTKALYKKGDTLVILHDIQQPGDFSGCVTGTNGQDGLEWNPAENFKFL